ncbi:uncharacterized protein C8Q71DRAFT_342130 [Rhodofomes roseus]|uniref:DUF6534 domain-containing protein n=1 Tax=Rhodofomes roseus TaxID=34475 RepID=A0ABQ8KSG2_9APHY|nr:uncharacterized protein C8Q71DRAFT_342130 [Rhodofomes roseus]KAH9841652.1 hypothetical protein C8Q71DRAFT_342130 [Rhodofomes roseus]
MRMTSLTPRSFGSFFIGTTIATALYGCVCAQLIYYLKRYSDRDGKIMRSLIISLCALDTLSIILSVDGSWYYTVQNHGKMPISAMPRSSPLEHLNAAAVTFLVRSFDLFTLWKLSARRRHRVPLIVTNTALSVIAFGSSLSMLGYESQMVRDLWQMLQEPKMQISIQTLTACIANLSVCASICWVVRAESAKLAANSIMRSTVRRYTLYTVLRNLLAALVELFAFMTYIKWRDGDSYYWTMLHIPSSKVYVNSVLAMLNARNSLAEYGQDRSTCPDESIVFATIITLVPRDITDESV